MSDEHDDRALLLDIVETCARANPTDTQFDLFRRLAGIQYRIQLHCMDHKERRA